MRKPKSEANPEPGLTSPEKKPRKSVVKQSDVPRYSLSEAVRIAQAISDNYAKAPTKPFNVAAALELSPNSSHFRGLVGASSAYGLTEGAHDSEFISLTDLGRRLVAPTEEGMDEAAKREALLKPRIIQTFLTRYNHSKIPPDKRIPQNVLVEMGVPADSAEQVFQLIMRGADEVGLLQQLKGHTYVNLDLPAPRSSIPTLDTWQTTDEDEPQISNPASHRRDRDPLGELPAVNNRVFITHGKNLEIVKQLKELLAFGSFVPVVAAEHETVSKPVPDKVLDEMRSCYAAIIHVGREIKLLDREGNEHTFLNQNVLIEIGAAMALYGRRFILLVERGASLPSNLQGLYEVRYEGDRLDYDATMKLLRAFNEFKG